VLTPDAIVSRTFSAKARAVRAGDLDVDAILPFHTRVPCNDAIILCIDRDAAYGWREWLGERLGQLARAGRAMSVPCVRGVPGGRHPGE
jgi:hypothetical protein